MELQLRLIIISVCVITLVFFGEAVRRGKIMLHITFPWLFCLAITGVLAIFPPLIDQVARVLGVINSMNALFFCAFIFLSIVVFFSYATMSKLRQETVRLIQETALLEYELRRRTSEEALRDDTKI